MYQNALQVWLSRLELRVASTDVKSLLEFTGFRFTLLETGLLGWPMYAGRFWIDRPFDRLADWITDSLIPPSLFPSLPPSMLVFLSGSVCMSDCLSLSPSLSLFLTFVISSLLFFFFLFVGCMMVTVFYSLLQPAVAGPHIQPPPNDHVGTSYSAGIK